MLQKAAVGPIAILTLSREGAGNSLNAALADALIAAVDEIADDRDVRALIIAGAGERFFCTGGDVREYAAIDTEDAILGMVDRLGAVFSRLTKLSIPVVAAIDGYALGAGAELAFACDLRVISEGSVIGFPQTGIGVIPCAFTFRRMLSLAGYGTAYELIALGAQVSARQAMARGLVSDLTDPGQAQTRAIELCQALCEKGQDALASTKGLLALAAAPEGRYEAAFRQEFPQLWFSDFHRSREQAFMARRNRAAQPRPGSGKPNQQQSREERR